MARKAVKRVPKRRKPPKLKNTTIRDFGGGLNISDSEQALTSKYAPVFDNMIVYQDRSVSPRWGFKTELLLHNGSTLSGTANHNFTCTLDSRAVVISWTGHPFFNGQHITISGITTGLAGAPDELLNGTFGVVVIDANSFAIAIDTPATVTDTDGLDFNWTRDTHAFGGTPVDCKYFSNHLIVVDSIGEINAIDSDNVVTRLWSYAIADGYAGDIPPWGHTHYVAWDVFGKRLELSNGVDKPLRIDFSETLICDYVIDPGEASTNTYIPAYDAVKAAFQYLAVHDTADDYETTVRVSAKKTDCVFADATDPLDSVDVDVSKHVASAESEVIGFAILKNALMCIMPNSTILLQLGTNDTLDIHDPIPIDTLVGFGTSARRTIIELPSDVFMVDYNGVPSAKLSQLSNAIVPERASGNIESLMAKNIARLTKRTLKDHAFGFYDGRNKCIHWYMPKFDDDDTTTLRIDPFSFDEDMAGTGMLLMRFTSHQLEIGDTVYISGAAAFSVIDAAEINGLRNVVGVIDENYIMITCGHAIPSNITSNGGGGSVSVNRCNDETIGYIYHYQPTNKINAWSRFKGMNLNCGCSTIEGRVFVFDDDKMYRYGSESEPVYADNVSEYDSSWAASTAYAVNDRIRDTSDGKVYLALEAGTFGTTSFSVDRNLNPDSWEEYLGEPIEFEWELPWSDMGTRQLMKGLRFIHVDATGEQEFTVDAFVDNQYKSAATGVKVPARSIAFVPNDAPAYGEGDQMYGGGRRTREQLVWSYQARFKLIKVRVRGSAQKRLRFNALSFLYLPGGFVRG